MPVDERWRLPSWLHAGTLGSAGDADENMVPQRRLHPRSVCATVTRRGEAVETCPKGPLDRWSRSARQKQESHSPTAFVEEYVSTLHGVVSTCKLAYCNTWSIWRCSSSSGTLHNPLLTPHTQFFLLWLKRCGSKSKTSANSNDWMLIGFTIGFIFRFHTEKVWNASSSFFTFLLFLLSYDSVTFACS